MYNGNVVVHTTYGNFVYMLYGQFFFHIACGQFSICCMDKYIFRTTYGQVVYMLYGKVLYICHTDKYMSDYMERVHNKSIDMTYL